MTWPGGQEAMSMPYEEVKPTECEWCYQHPPTTTEKIPHPRFTNRTLEIAVCGACAERIAHSKGEQAERVAEAKARTLR